MNRYPLWKYILIVFSLIAAVIYMVPNFYGESPAVQISSARSAVKVDTALLQTLETALASNKVTPDSATLENGGIRFRFSNTDVQLKARDLIQQTLGNDDYIVALNLISSTPDWMTRIGAKPMALGLDLRGGVHFLLEVDMVAAVNKALDKAASDVRRELRDAGIRYGSIQRQSGDRLVIQLRDQAEEDAAYKVIDQKMQQSLQVARQNANGEFALVATFRPEALQRLKEASVKQNVSTLHNRINELGVAEAAIQQQGADRIVVELPGIQDTAKAKDILGRTATLEVRMVEDDPDKVQQAIGGNVPVGYELMDDASSGRSNASKILLRKEVELTGDNINDAVASFGERGEPAVAITLDSAGASIFRDVTRASIGKRMAMVLVEKGRGEAVTAPVIRSEIGGGRVQISGAMNVAEANDLALLLRAGSLAAPMTIVEERTIGPSLGQDNIVKGIDSVVYGFIAIAVFMIIYYTLFGAISVIALSINLCMLVALLSLMQATMTLPGIAALALSIGVAVDSNVLINERIREELRAGMKPQTAIREGYSHAWRTILDSNVTTFIAGAALFIFGSGSVRGFAIVHCLGILTSLYTSVFISRGIVNLLHGYRRRIDRLWI